MCRETGPYETLTPFPEVHDDQHDNYHDNDENGWYERYLFPVMEHWGGCDGGNVMIDLGAYDGDTYSKFYQETEGELFP